MSTATSIPVKGTLIGKPINRVDGKLKVTGAAPYAAEANLEGMAYGILVGSSIASGRITSIDTKAAMKLPGVLSVITRENRGKLGKPPSSMAEGLMAESRMPLENDEIHYVGQYVALVVAETLEQAQYAASRLAVTYEHAEHILRIEDSTDAYKPKQFNGEEMQVQRGDVDKGLADSAVRLDETYETPCQHPNAMEPHAAISHWENGVLTVRNATQFAYGDLGVLAGVFDLSKEKVHIIAPYIGGMFGSKAATGGHVILSAVAARELKRPVKIVLTREQVMTTVGFRPRTIQRFELGADKDGKLNAMRHSTVTQTSALDEFVEPCNLTSRHLYEVPNYVGAHDLRRVHTMLPSWMRGPGETPCQFAQESAMDELAIAAGIDPIELRRRNDAVKNGHTGKPFSSKHLMQCFDEGAKRFGWAKRNPQAGSMTDGRLQIGMGVATATYPGYLMGASVHARLEAAGSGVKLVVQTAAADVGTGVYTLVSLTAAEALSLPLEAVTAELGDSHYPYSSVSGGSNLTASVAPAVYDACTQIRSKLCGLAIAKGGPLAGVDADDLEYSEGRISSNGKSVSYAELLAGSKKDGIEAKAETKPIFGQNDKFAFQSFGAIFVEVAVDPELHTVRMRRLTGVFDAGRIMNSKAARSQMLGGMTFGVGMALLEEMVADPAPGRFINADLGDYLVPVNADVPDIDVSFINEPDLEFNTLGCRGVGELGSPGTAAAIANAVYHATGKRIRSAPITPEKLMAATAVRRG